MQVHCPVDSGGCGYTGEMNGRTWSPYRTKCPKCGLGTLMRSSAIMALSPEQPQQPKKDLLLGLDRKIVEDRAWRRERKSEPVSNESVKEAESVKDTEPVNVDWDKIIAEIHEARFSGKGYVGRIANKYNVPLYLARSKYLIYRKSIKPQEEKKARPRHYQRRKQYCVDCKRELKMGDGARCKDCHAKRPIKPLPSVKALPQFPEFDSSWSMLTQIEWFKTYLILAKPEKS